MDKKLKIRINSYFFQLVEFVNKLPLNEYGKSYIILHSYHQIYDNPNKSENGKTTYGIQTEWQLQRFIEQFKKNFQKLRLMAVEKYTDELNKIKPSEAVAKIDNKLYELRKEELLTEIGADGLNDWKIWLKKYYSNEIEYHKKRPDTKQPKQQKKTSYEWQSNPDKELPELYNLMIDKYKLIASETSYEQFKAVFTGQPIDEVKPIRWHQDNATELLYFISRLEQTSNIKYNPKRTDYQRLIACFVKPDGKPFKAEFKALKTNIDINLSESRQRSIDELINKF